MAPKMENIFSLHPTAVVAQDVDLVGNVTIGHGCVIHPSCTIVALGPIIFGPQCIVEERALICNRRRDTPMEIGPENLFCVGSRVEALSIGSHNVFEAKCKVSPDVRVGNYCVIGASCAVVADPCQATFEVIERLMSEFDTEEARAQEYNRSEVVIRELKDYSVLYGDRADLRTWSGEGRGQARALHAKHLQYLHETLPKFHRTRVAGPPKPK